VLLELVRPIPEATRGNPSRAESEDMRTRATTQRITVRNDNSIFVEIIGPANAQIDRDLDLAKLQALGVPERTVRDLLRNRWFTPTLQTALTARLSALGKRPGIDAVVATAAATQGEARARFLLESLALLAAFHEKEAKLTAVRMSNLVPTGTTADGRVVAAVAIDYAAWDKDAQAFTQRKETAAPKRTLLVAGKVSPEAKRGLEKAGWTIKAGLRA